VIFVINIIFVQVKSAPVAQNNEVVIRSDGLVVKNKNKHSSELDDTLDVLTQISDNFEQNYRSVSAVTDFSKVVVGMMDSLKDLELKGDDMMKKIDVQESHLKSLDQEIDAKEEYITVVNEKVKESEAFFNDLQAEVKEIESRKTETEEAMKRNENKIKAQEVRLRRLVKDITTKVEYVNVVDTKIQEIEAKVDGTTKTLEMLEKEKKKAESKMVELENRSSFAKQQVSKFNQEILEKEKLHRETNIEMQKYTEEIARLKEEFTEYQLKVEQANDTLSNLEKATKEISPQDDLIDPKLLVPAFAASMIANLLMGGHILSQVPSTLSQSLNLGTSLSSEKVEEKIQDAAFNYKEDDDDIDANDDLYPGYDNYIGYESYEGYNPLQQLESIKKEREEMLGKKNEKIITKNNYNDFMRRSDFPELAYSY